MPARRLTHTTNAAFRRYMQVSNANTFVFVEGKTDQYFYSKICETVLSPKGIDFQICLAQELPGSTGGKNSLLKFFSYLKRVDSLVDDFRGRKKVSIFYLDKDIDDILRKTKSSDHIVYTQYYSVENYFFSNGNLVDAVAAAASLTLSTARQRFRHSNREWQRVAAQNWQDWVKLCVFCSKRQINYDCNYGVISRINNGPYTPVDPVLHATRLAELERRSHLSARGFKMSFGRVARDVDKLFRDDEFDSVFKGKWYVFFLAHDATRLSGGKVIAPGELLKSLQVTLNPNAAWANYFKNPLEKLIRLL